MPERLRAYIASLDAGESYTIDRLDSPDQGIGGAIFGKTAIYDDRSGYYRISIDQKASSRVTIHINHGTVVKTVSAFSEFKILEREVRWLATLQATGIVPELISYTSNTLTLEYRGEPVRQHNLPKDWRQQASSILSILAKHGCCHNDIKCDNLVVLNDKLSLIDFGWATGIDEVIPNDWPQGIGRQHRLGVHKFDDKKAMVDALISAENNMIDRSIVLG